MFFRDFYFNIYYMNKICKKGGTEKDISEFYINTCKCKKCRIEYQKELSLNKKDYIKEYKKEHRLKNKDKISEKSKNYYQDNKDYIKQKSNNYYSLNKEEKLKYQKEYNKNNKENRNFYATNRKQNDPLFKLRCSMTNMVYSSLKRKGYTKKSHTYEIIGCSYEFLLGYLEAKFENWMMWENYGKYNGEINYGFDIDHIIPLSSAKNEEELLRLNHYSNLQPLCSKINRDIKKDNIIYTK